MKLIRDGSTWKCKETLQVLRVRAGSPGMWRTHECSSEELSGKSFSRKRVFLCIQDWVMVDSGEDEENRNGRYGVLTGIAA